MTPLTLPDYTRELPDDTYFCARDLAAMLGVGKVTVASRVKAGLLPPPDQTSKGIEALGWKTHGIKRSQAAHYPGAKKKQHWRLGTLRAFVRQNAPALSGDDR